MDLRPNKYICSSGAGRVSAASTLLAAALIVAAAPDVAQGQCAPACGKDNVECLSGPAYTNRTSVGRVTTPGGGCCTGWVIAAPDLILTNRHCITTNGTVGGTVGTITNMNIIMNLECTLCIGGVNKPTTTFNATALIADSIALDYAILRVNGNIAASWGQLSLDATPPVNGNGVYEIHHAACDSKGVDFGNVTGGVAPNLCIIGTTHEFPVNIIASQGASGAPIFRSTNHAVVGICHCGPPCSAGFGVPMSAILPNVINAIIAAGGSVNVVDGPGCPATGSCYVAHSTPGCNDKSCCATVCAVDPFCCNNQWDSICVDEAFTFCGNCGSSGAGNCYTANGTPGCNDSDCCEAVCIVDPFCCNVQWDSLCADAAFTTCGNCGGSGAGNCYTANGTPGCNDPDCCEMVCVVDPFCCNVQWDGICANEAAELCGNCGTSTASCYAAHSGTGCNDVDCCAQVCAIDSFCCQTQWDSICAGEAAELCGQCGVNPESCFVPHSSVGCNNAACCASVCAVDPFCCETQWDGICSDEAATMCAGCGSPGAGNCYAAHANVGCDQSPCCENVCAIDPFCCKVSWDGLCADQAAELCGQCGLSTESCFVAHSTVGCNNETCCASVCAVDPFCCNVQWDGICADEAATMCAGCGSAAAGNCYSSNGSIGCNQSPCCENVCAIDPFCCKVSWDSICADEAAQICGQCGVNPASCFVAHPSVGCSDFDCCALICSFDPFCCNVEWDGICASSALANCADPCPADCAPPPNGDGQVNVQDLLLVINQWGPCVGCAADVAPPPAGDGQVNVQDLLAVINQWGPCP